MIGNLDQHRRVFILDRTLKVGHVHRGQHGKRHLGTDASDANQQAKQRLFFRRGEPVQHLRVLANQQMRLEKDVIAGRRQLEKRAHRRFDLVADAVTFDDDGRRLLVDQPAAQ